MSRKKPTRASRRPSRADDRPDIHNYFMTIAMAVRRRANCLGNRVGAIIVQDNRIISTGYNGTPHGMKNCLNGGCHRCANRAAYPSGTGYDLCICVHAEQNALLSAARFGIEVEGGVVYTTMQPCFGCTKEMLQAKVHAVYYLHEWVHPERDKRQQYDHLQSYFPGGLHRLDIADADANWAISSKRALRPTHGLDETGHTPA
jgi:dCMP deaminase